MVAGKGCCKEPQQERAPKSPPLKKRMSRRKERRAETPWPHQLQLKRKSCQPVKPRGLDEQGQLPDQRTDLLIEHWWLAVVVAGE